jgi:parvulin-like peptidyl-prolyl isomerase
MDLEVDDSYKVEHNENFEMNKEQFRKLIEDKFTRNGKYARLIKPRESELKDAR